MRKGFMGFALKPFLMVSLALNVGLISKVVFEGENWIRRPKDEAFIGGFCLSENKNRDASSSLIKARCGAHFRSSRTGLSPSSSSSATNCTEVRGRADNGGVINLDHGDPTMYESYWQQMGDKITVVISGWQYVSYFSDARNLCWFLEPELANAVVRLHKVVGNAITEDRHIVVGTGSSQLYHAVLYALSPADSPEPISVVSAAPFYSSYPLMTDYLKSGLHRWAGDAYSFKSDIPYIELVTSPNNPDGSTRQAVVNRDNGILVHDLAYYWPQYTPITSSADHNIMLFTVSKSTGHAGSRIGWALVKDEETAKKMTKFIEINTIGVSKDSQVRAAKILEAVSDGYDIDKLESSEKFFEYGYNNMVKRWKKLRSAVEKSGCFSLPDFSSGVCNFSGRTFPPQPAFAWLKCEGEEIEDCESFLRGHNILTRGGKHFGVGPEYVRISMLDRDDKFNLFTQRLSTIHA